MFFQRGPKLQLLQNTRGKIGNRTSVLETDDLGNTSRFDWVYDELGRLTEERYDSFNNLHDSITRYAFDLASNRVKLTKDTGNALPASFTADETTDYLYDQNDRLTSESKDVTVGTANDSNTTYSYIGTQQTVKTVRTGSKDVGSGTISETHTSQYNVQGRMSQNAVAVGGTTTTYTYKYNPDGIRVIQTEKIGAAAMTTTVFHIDPNNHTGFAQILEEGIEAAGTVDGKLQTAEIGKSYTLGHDVIAQATAANTPHYFLYDGHGSTRALLTALAAVLNGNQRFAYDAYGNMLLAGVTGYAASPAAALTSLLYSGERTDQTGLQYLRARYYDPRTGRFNRLDPFAGNTQDPLSLHKYLYAHADSVNGIDPTGQFSVIQVQIAITIGSTLSGIAIGYVIDGPRGAIIGGGLGFGVGASVAFFWGAPIQRVLIIHLAKISALVGGGTVAGDRLIKSRFGQVAIQRLDQLRDAGTRSVELFTRIGSSPATNRSLHTATSRALADGGGRASRATNELYRIRIPHSVLKELESIGAAERQVVLEQVDDATGEAWVFFQESIPYLLQFMDKIK